MIPEAGRWERFFGSCRVCGCKVCWKWQFVVEESSVAVGKEERKDARSEMMEF